MKYLKTYQLFESTFVKLEDFPEHEEILEYFYDVTDEQEHYHYGVSDDPTYVLFTVYPGLNRELSSQLSYDISYEKDWINKKVDLLNGDTWSEFITTADYEGKLYPEFFDKQIYGYTGDKTLGKRIYEEALKGTIKLYPIIYINITVPNPDKMIECLERFYEATGFRPIGDYNEEDFVDEDNGDIVTLHAFDLKLFKVNDVEYKRLIKGSVLSNGLKYNSSINSGVRNKNNELTSKFL